MKILNRLMGVCILLLFPFGLIIDMVDGGFSNGGVSPSFSRSAKDLFNAWRELWWD